MESEIIEAWTQARARGETVALMANSNEAVRRLNRLAQQTRILNGEISVRAGAARLGEEVICVGDQVVTHRNDRTLRTDGGHMVKNRDRWTIDTIHPDRSITLTGDTGTIRIPADYAAADLELGYAQTSHATQGRTVDTALLLVDRATDHARSREGNHAYVVTEDNQSALDVLTQAVGREWIDQPAYSHLDPPEPASPRQRTHEEELAHLTTRARRAMERRKEQTRDMGLGR